jgi:hypothetical protein
MVAAVLIQMWSDLKKNGLPFVPGFLPGASTQERRRDRRGEYAAIMGLVRTLNQGMSSTTANTTCTHTSPQSTSTTNRQASFSSSSLTPPSTAAQVSQTYAKTISLSD